MSPEELFLRDDKELKISYKNSNIFTRTSCFFPEKRLPFSLSLRYGYLAPAFQPADFG
jgi:hypothetical protein